MDAIGGKMEIKQGRFVFLGDSITCADRLWNPGPEGLGNGYVSVLAESLRQQNPQIQIWNKGYDGFTLPFLLRNLQEDCIAKQPEFVCILIGINDIGVCKNTGMSLREQRFEENYRCLLGRIARETSARVLCLGPFIFPCPQEYEGWIPQVREAERDIAAAAQEFGAAFLPCHDFLNEACQDKGYREITTDGIHLTKKGHVLLARRIQEGWINHRSVL